MESFGEGGDMGPSSAHSETSHLVTSNTDDRKPSYLNMLSNLCGLLFLGIIMYCCFKDGPSLFSFHPILMTLGWMIFMTSAIHALTPGDVATGWMPIRLRSARHWVLQALAGSIVLLGFIIIVTNKFLHDAPHFVTIHAKFGLTSLIFMSLTMLGGIGALYSLKLKYYLAPIYTKLIHTSAGLVTFYLGVTTIILSFFSNWWIKQNNGEVMIYICSILVIISMCATTVRPVLKIYFRLMAKAEVPN